MALNLGLLLVTLVGFVWPSVKRSMGARGVVVCQSTKSCGSCDVPDSSAKLKLAWKDLVQEIPGSIFFASYEASRNPSLVIPVLVMYGSPVAVNTQLLKAFETRLV